MSLLCYSPTSLFQQPFALCVNTQLPIFKHKLACKTPRLPVSVSHKPSSDYDQAAFPVLLLVHCYAVRKFLQVIAMSLNSVQLERFNLQRNASFLRKLTRILLRRAEQVCVTGHLLCMIHCFFCFMCGLSCLLMCVMQIHHSGERAPGASQCCAMLVVPGSCALAHWARSVLLVSVSSWKRVLLEYRSGHK